MSLHSSTQFDPILVADVGGTNARFALITAFDEANNQFVIEHINIFPSADFSSLESALEQYLTIVPHITPKRACLSCCRPYSCRASTFNQFRLAF